MSADVHAPPSGAESTSSAFADAPNPSAASFARLRVRFADPPASAPPASGPAGEDDDDRASVMSNPPVVDKTVALLAAFIHD